MRTAITFNTQLCLAFLLIILQASAQPVDNLSTCSDKIFDPRDSNYYATVQIGTLCWMAENLNAGFRISFTKDQRDNNIIEKYCYDNKEENCLRYGGLYQWDEAMQYVSDPSAAGICPPQAGWHLPSDEEWCMLATFVDSTVDCSLFGASGNTAGQLKSAGTIESKTGQWHFPNEGGTDAIGFSALPAGTRSIYSKFFFLGYHGYFWSSSSFNDQNAWFWYLKYSNNSIYRENYFKASGYSVRCVKSER
jgi:uncharacterized protein (TIGR02145 family)